MKRKLARSVWPESPPGTEEVRRDALLTRPILSPYNLEIPLLKSNPSYYYRPHFDFIKAVRRWIFPFWPAGTNGEPFGPCLSGSETIVAGLIVASFFDNVDPTISRSYCPCRLIQN